MTLLSYVTLEPVLSPEPGTLLEGPLSVPVRMKPLVDRCLQLAQLPTNWDSRGGMPTRPDVIRLALSYLVQSGWEGPLPTASPTSAGGLQLEWGDDDNGVEFEVQPDGTCTVLVDVDGRMTEKQVANAWDPAFLRALNWAQKLST